MATDKKISELATTSSALPTDIIPVARSGANFSLTVAQIVAGSVPNSRQITTTSPLLGGGYLTSNLNLTIQEAGPLQAGYLSSIDWNKFNNKFNTPTGTINDYVRGDGVIAPFPTVTGFVPYTGANANVNLGEYSITTGQLNLDLSPTGTAVVGTTRWNNTNGITETTLLGGSVVLKNGIDLVARVVNKVSPNTTLTKADYQVVKIQGAQGQRLAVGLAQANNDNNSADTLGMVIETIDPNQPGFIMTVGQLEEIDTTGNLQGETWVDGDVLYLSPTIPGRVTKIKPNGSTGHIVVIGYVEYAHANNGKIYVKIMNGWELEELHDVYIPTYINNGTLYRDTATNLWKTATIPTILGYTPENVANKATTFTTINDILYPTVKAVNDHIDLKLTGLWDDRGSYDASLNVYPSLDGSGTAGAILKGDIWTINVQGILGGVTVHVGDTVRALVNNPGQTSTNWALLENNLGYVPANVLTTIATTSPLSGGGNLSANRTLSITEANATTDGYLSSTYWNAFNNKIDGSGTLNNLARFTATGTIGNGITQDDGTTVGIGSSPSTNTRLSVSASSQTVGLQVSGGLSAAITASGPGIGLSASSTGGFISSCAISATHTTNTGAVAGKFTASGTGTNYSLILQDGTQGTGKFLKSMDANGKANWALITVTNEGTSGPATVDPVTGFINIPQYSGGASVVGSADYLYLYNNFK